AGAEEICVVGGGEIYAQALPLADRLHVTHVLAAVDGDAHFPPIDPAIWRIVRSEDFPAGEKDSHATRYTVYERRGDGHWRGQRVADRSNRRRA
ncbi:MAG: dihydrofolate reductase, partial [Mesorhizobium sp.]